MNVPEPRVLFRRLVSAGAGITALSALVTLFVLFSLWHFSTTPLVGKLAMILSIDAALFALWVIAARTLIGRTKAIWSSLHRTADEAQHVPPSRAVLHEAFHVPGRVATTFVLANLGLGTLAGALLERETGLGGAMAVALVVVGVALGLEPIVFVTWRRVFAQWLDAVSALDIEAAPAMRSRLRVKRALVMPLLATTALCAARLASEHHDSASAAWVLGIAWLLVAAGCVAAAARTGKRLGEQLSDDVAQLEQDVANVSGLEASSVRDASSATRRVGLRTRAATELAHSLEKLATRFVELAAREDEARKSTEQLQQVKTQFVASMSHDLRNPLNSILGFADMLLSNEQDPLSPAQRESMTVLRQSAEELMRVLTDVLDTAKLAAGKLTLRREWTPAVEILTQAVTRGRAAVGGRPVQVVAELQPGLPAVHVDGDRIVQAIVLIVERAVRMMESGTVRLRASVATGPPGPPRQVRIEIIDAGAALPESDRARIFEAFRQVAGPASRRQGRLGLGLALSRALVASHGGDVWCESRQGRGTTFTLVLPVDERRSS